MQYTGLHASDWLRICIKCDLSVAFQVTSSFFCSYAFRAWNCPRWCRNRQSADNTLVSSILWTVSIIDFCLNFVRFVQSNKNTGPAAVAIQDVLQGRVCRSLRSCYSSKLAPGGDRGTIKVLGRCCQRRGCFLLCLSRCSSALVTRASKAASSQRSLSTKPSGSGESASMAK